MKPEPFDRNVDLWDIADVATDLEARMSVESHLAELERRHEALKREIHEAQGHPGADDFEISALKRRKLQLKDRIAELKQSETMH